LLAAVAVEQVVLMRITAGVVEQVVIVSQQVCLLLLGLHIPSLLGVVALQM
jgi:hypothetical protein